MSRPDTPELADELFVALSLLVRRLKQTRDDTLSLPEVSALKVLEDAGPATLTTLAKLERISAQSLGVTLDALESRHLIRRAPDPADGRQNLVSLTAKGGKTLRERRSGRAAHLARVLSTEFAAGEREALHAAVPLLERLARAL